MVTSPSDQVQHPLLGQVELGCDLRRLRVTAQLTFEVSARSADLVELLDDVDRKTHHAGLLGDTAGDRLADPPGRIGRELEALLVVELLNGPDQAGVALLYE